MNSAIRRMAHRGTIAERLEFHSIPEPNSGCLLWLGPMRGGYGRMVVGGRGGKQVGVHRLSWIERHGPIPHGLHVLHKCDNRACLNPEHLFLGTNQDNMDDRNKKGRQAHLRGESSGQAKFTEKDIIAIREAPGLLREIASRFGTSLSHVSGIKKGYRWSHLWTGTTT